MSRYISRLFVALVLFAPVIPAFAQGLTVGNYKLISETVVTRTASRYAYTADITNTGPAAIGVTATVTSTSPTTVINQNSLMFGNVAAGAVVTSSNTFTFTQDRTVQFDPAALHWTVQSNTGPQPPVANAGSNQSIGLGAIVHLDGSGSTDPNGHALTYLWSFVSKPAGSNANLSSATAVNPTFIADKLGTFILSLVVGNGTLSSIPAQVVISTGPVPPTANAGPNQTINAGATVHLDGSGSTDPGGLPLTYLWSFSSRPAGSAATLSSATAVAPTFLADLAGSYVLRLTVNNGAFDSAPAQVTITSNDVPPVANPGPNQTVTVGANVTLNGSGSTDVNGHALTFAWSFTSIPAGSAAALNNPTSVMPTFVADRPGTYVVQLIVNDGVLNSPPATVTVSTQAVAPTANAGANQMVNVSTTVQLDGTGSTDPNGLPLTYRWSLTARPQGSSAALSSTTAARPAFTADRAGTYVAQLIVADSLLTGSPATVTISTVNIPPVANAGPNQNVNPGQTVTLDGSASKGTSGYPLTYSWSLSARPLGSIATLSNPTSANPSFSPDFPGAYVAQLIVNDNVQNSAPATVQIFAAGVPAPKIILQNLTIGNNLQQFSAFFVGLAAPSGGLVVTLASGDPTKLLLSNDAAAVGSATVDVIVSAGSSQGALYLQALAGSGTVVVTASAPGYSSGSSTVTLVPSGFVLTTVNGSDQSFSTTILSPPTSLSIFPASLDPATLKYNYVGVVRAGITASVDVTSSNASAGTISGSPVTFSSGGSAHFGQFQPVGAGNTVLTVNQPPGFSTPSNYTTAVATVTVNPRITVGDAQVGKDLQISANINLAAPAPAGGVTITVTSSDVSKVLLSTSATAPGSGSVTLPVNAGLTSSNTRLYIQALASSGNVTLTASAPSFEDGTGTVTLNPSGFVLYTFDALGQPFSTSPGSDYRMLVIAARLDPITLNYAAEQSIRGGATFTVPLTDSNTGAGTVPASVTFNGDDSEIFALFHAVDYGTTVIATVAPPGFSTPGNDASIMATVGLPQIYQLFNETLGNNLQSIGANVGLHTPAPPGGEVITLTSSDPTKVLISTSPTASGSASVAISIAAGSSQSIQRYYVQALAATGTVLITASGSGFGDATGIITLVPSGFIISPTVFTANSGGPNVMLNVYPSRLDPTTLNSVSNGIIRGGLSGVAVPVTSSNPSVGAITDSPLIFSGNQSTLTTAFTPLTTGTSVISIGTPAGFSTSGNVNQARANVN